MRHTKLFLAAAAVLAGSVSTVWADSPMAINYVDVSLPAISSSPITAPSSDTAAPTLVPLSPVVEIAYKSKDQPEALAADPSPSVSRLGVLPVRPTAQHARAHSCYAQKYRPARVAKRAGQAQLAPLRGALRRGGAPSAAQCSHCWTVVLLGVGY